MYSYFYRSNIVTQGKITGTVFEYLNLDSIQYLHEKGADVKVFEELGAELDKYKVFMTINNQLSNSKLSHFEVSEIKHEENIEDFNKIVTIVNNVQPLTNDEIRLMRLTKTSVLFGNVECKNKRESKSEAEKAFPLLNFTENDRIFLFFQITYIKLVIIGYFVGSKVAV